MNHPALRGILLDAPFDDLTLLVTLTHDHVSVITCHHHVSK